jgi:hypothetical protein
MLDRQAEAERLLTSAVRERLPDESVVAGPRRLVLGLLAERHPLSGLLEGSEWFWRVVDASPTLIGRLREIREELERSLAASLAEEIGREPDDPDARLLAGSVVAALGIVHGLAQRGLQAGRTADALYPELAAVADRLFDQIEHGIGPVGLGPADRSVG